MRERLSSAIDNRTALSAPGFAYIRDASSHCDQRLLSPLAWPGGVFKGFSFLAWPGGIGLLAPDRDVPSWRTPQLVVRQPSGGLRRIANRGAPHSGQRPSQPGRPLGRVTSRASAMVTFSPQTHRAWGPGSCASECRELRSTMAPPAYSRWIARTPKPRETKRNRRRTAASSYARGRRASCLLWHDLVESLMGIPSAVAVCVRHAGMRPRRRHPGESPPTSSTTGEPWMLPSSASSSSRARDHPSKQPLETVGTEPAPAVGHDPACSRPLQVSSLSEGALRGPGAPERLRLAT
jgi:hypothetical protein